MSEIKAFYINVPGDSTSEAEIKYQRGHINLLVQANNAELDRRRAAEAEVEKLRVDLILSRNECARLREVLTSEALYADEENPELSARLRHARLPRI